MTSQTALPRPEQIGQICATFSVRHRWWLVPLLALACIGVGSFASTLRFAGDYRVFFGSDNPDFIANEDMQGTFGRPDNIAFVVIPRDGDVFTQSTLTAVRALTEASWTLPYVSRVDSLTNFQNTVGQGDDLIVDDLVLDPSELTPDGIEAVRTAALAEPLVRGFVVSSDQQATVISATVQLPAGIANAASEAANAARDIRAEILDRFPDLDIHITGVASLSAAFEEAGTRDASTLIPAVYAFILVAMLIALRSISAVIASLILIALATCVGVGVGGLTGVQLTPISLAAPTIILTIAVADAIHVIAGIRRRMRDGTDKRQAIIDSTTLNFTPIGITSLTTVVGFLTLNFSDSPPFHHLGNMSAAGIAAAWLLSISLLPALLAILPMRFRPIADSAPNRSDLMSRMAELVIARPRLIAGTTLAACLVAIAFTPSMQINDQWSKYFDRSLEFRQAIDASEPFFGSDTVEFVLDPGVANGVTQPEFLKTVDALAAWLRDRDEVGHVFALSDIMRRLNRNLNEDDPAFYRIPDDAALASQYLLVYELSLPYGLDLNNRVDIDRRSTRVTATMRDISTGETRAFLADVDAWFEQNGGPFMMQTTGSKVLFSFVAQRNIEAVLEGAVYLVDAIFVILSITFRSIRVGLVSLVPNVLPIATAFGIWAILVGTVGFSVAAVGAVAVGLIVDFTVHFMAKYLRARQIDGKDVADAVRYAFQTAGSAILLTTVILTAGFAVLVTSTFKLNADLGLLTAIAIVLAMLVNFLLLPAMFLIATDHERHRTPSAA
ncbi:MAG: MMPL family transporter [Planctomycetota bacterium]